MAKDKKGQMVFFMLAGVIVLLIVVYALYLMTAKTVEPVKKEAPSQMVLGDVSALNSFVIACLDETASDALINFGLVGGKTGYFKEFLIYDTVYQIPYYFKTNTFEDSASIVPGTILAPSKSDVEGILSQYIDAHLQECTNGFKNVKGLRISEGTPKSSVLINEKDVSVKLEYPLTVDQGGKETSLHEFSVKILHRLNTMIQIASNITNLAKDREDIIYWDYLTDVTHMCDVLSNPRAPSSDQCFNITAHAERQNTIVYRIVDPQSLIYNEPYFFQFAEQVRVK